MPVPCYNLVGTIQGLCAYSKAMISQGTRTFILNMQKQQRKVHSFRRTASPSPRPRGSPDPAASAAAGEGQGQPPRSHSRRPAHSTHLVNGAYFFFTLLRLNFSKIEINLVTCKEGCIKKKKRKRKANPINKSHTHTHIDPHTVLNAKDEQSLGTLP